MYCNIADRSLMSALGRNETSVNWLMHIWIALLMVSESLIEEFQVHKYRNVVKTRSFNNTIFLF